MEVTKEYIIEKTYSFGKSPLTPLLQRGEFLPFVKGGKEGFNLLCLHNYGLTIVNVLNMETSSYVGQAFRPACSKAKALPYINFTSTYLLRSP